MKAKVGNQLKIHFAERNKNIHKLSTSDGEVIWSHQVNSCQSWYVQALHFIPWWAQAYPGMEGCCKTPRDLAGRGGKSSARKRDNFPDKMYGKKNKRKKTQQRYFFMSPIKKKKTISAEGHTFFFLFYIALYNWFEGSRRGRWRTRLHANMTPWLFGPAFASCWCSMFTRALGLQFSLPPFPSQIYLLWGIKTASFMTKKNSDGETNQFSLIIATLYCSW